MRIAIKRAIAVLLIAILFQFNTYAAEEITINLTNTYVQNEDNSPEKPINFNEPDKDKPNKIINFPADFSEENTKIGEITAHYEGGKIKINGQEYDSLPDQLSGEIIAGGNQNENNSNATFSKMGDLFSFTIIIIWILSFAGLGFICYKKFKNKSKER